MMNKTEAEKQELKDCAFETEKIEQELNASYKLKDELGRNINLWKNNIQDILKVECYEIEKNIIKEIKIKQEEQKKNNLDKEICNSIDKLLNDKDYMAISIRKISETASKYNELSRRIGIEDNNQLGKMDLTVNEIQKLEKNIFALDNMPLAPVKGDSGLSNSSCFPSLSHFCTTESSP